MLALPEPLEAAIEQALKTVPASQWLSAARRLSDVLSRRARGAGAAARAGRGGEFSATRR